VEGYFWSLAVPLVAAELVAAELWSGLELLLEAVLGIVEVLEVAELWLWSGVVDAAPAVLVELELCAEVVEGFVRSMFDDEPLADCEPAPTLLAEVSFDTGGVVLVEEGVVVDDWLALLGELGTELLGLVAAAPVALWSGGVVVLELVGPAPLQESEIMLTELTCKLLLSVCVPFTSTWWPS